jgi:hypothetical protein
MIPLVVMLALFSQIFDSGEDYEVYKSQIEVVDSEIAFGDTPSGSTIAVIGTIKNSSPVPWKEIHFHVDFFNAAGRRVDVGQRADSWLYLPANGENSFKVSLRREFAETEYE